MMEILRDILAAEGKAEQIIQRARDESTRIRTETDTEAEELLRRRKEEARAIAHERVEHVRFKTREDAERRLEEEKKRIAGFADTHREQIDELVERIVERVSSTEGGGA